MEDLLRRVHAYWEKATAHAEMGVPAQALSEFESRHGVRLPAAFRQLYLSADGNVGDGNLTRFWPLSEVCRIGEVGEVRDASSTLPEARSYFAFADYMIFSHVYAVRLSSDGSDGPVLWLYGRERPAEIASTFEAFLQMYADDPDSILFPSGM